MNQNIVKEILYNQNISPAIMALVLGVAFVLGAIHAMGPGHGKSLMAAYLVGAKGKVQDALVLGLTITISHVFSVIVIGLVALQVADFFKTEKVSLWLGLVSGILIVGIGLWLFVSRFRNLRRKSARENFVGLEKSQSGELQLGVIAPVEANSCLTSQERHSYYLANDSLIHSHPNGEGHTHSQGHGHHHHHYNPDMSLWSNIALGVSGGIVPCPKALVILLLAISLQRIGLGIVIISVFSLGLAAVLIAIGIIMVKASHLLKGKFEDRRIQFLPVLGSLVIIALGLFLSVRTILIM